MADDNRAQIILDGDISPLRRAFKEAEADLKRFGNDGASAFERMMGPLGALHSKILGVTALLAGGAVFKEAVGAAKDFNVEVGKLSSTLGISEDAAVALRFALGDIYVEQETFAAGISKLTQTANQAPEKFQALGVALTDTKGKSRDMLSVMMDVNSKIMEFAEGQDRARAAAYVYGKNWQEIQKVLKLTNERLQEGADKARSLGVELDVEQIKAYRAAMNDAGDVVDAMQIRIGSALIPSLKDMAVYFAEIGGPVIDGVLWAFKHLVQFLDETVTAFNLAWNDIKLVFNQITTALGRIGAVAVAAAKGDVALVKSVWAAGREEMLSNEKTHLSEYERINQAHAARVAKLWGKGGEAGAKSEGKGGKGAKFTLSEKEGKEESRLDVFERQLAMEKDLASQRNALREFSKAQELAFWEGILANETMSQKDRLAIEKRLSLLRVDVRREEAKQLKDLDDEGARAGEARALAKIDAEQAAAEALLAGDEITQQQALKMEEEFELRRFEIKRAYAEARKAQLADDPDHNPVEMARIKNKLLELEQQYQIKRSQLQGKQMQLQKVELDKNLDVWRSLGQRVSGLWDKGVQAMMNGTLRWKNATKAIGMELAGWFATNVVGKMVSSWLAGKAAEFAISMGWMTKQQAAKLGFIAAETAAEQAADVTQTVSQHAAGVTGVMSNSAIAATAAMASVAAIPFVGWAMAPGVGASTYAMGMAYLASARDGYDIPAGVNPMTQLHEREMVLPAEHADTIRALRDGAGGGGGTNIVINALDARSVKDYLKANAHALGPALRRLGRNASPTRA